MSMTEAIKSLSQLSESKLLKRLGELDSERKAVMVLLRAVRASKRTSSAGDVSFSEPNGDEE